MRVGVSAARGFALALKIPAIGVTTLEAIAAEARETFGRETVLAALDAGRGEIHAAIYDESGSDAVRSGRDHACTSRRTGEETSPGACRLGGRG